MAAARHEAELLRAGESAPVAEAVAPVLPLSTDDAAILDGIDLTDLPDLLPILEAMIAGSPVPPALDVVEAPEVAAPEVAAPEVAAPEAVPEAVPEPIEAVVAEAPTASGVHTDAGERFDTFWNAPEPPEPEKAVAWWSSAPMAALVGMVAVVMIVVLLLALIG